MVYVNLESMNYWNLLWLDDYLVGHNGFICGGCFKNIMNRERVKDLDIFFRSEEDWHKACLYFDDEVRKDDAVWSFNYENKKVKSYKNKKTGIVIELCKTVFGEPKDVLDKFDFTITKFAYYKEEVEDETGAEVTPFDDPYDDVPQDLKDLVDLGLYTKEEAIAEHNKKAKAETHYETRIICHENFFEHLHMNRLVIDDQILFPMSTLERMFRYVGYGFKPCRETKLKIAKALGQVPAETMEASESFYDGID